MNPLTRSILSPLSRLYGSQIAKRNARFDSGRGVFSFDRPVVSVGNLSVGGTGKTPMVRRIVALLRDRGIDPCIAMRGYGSGRRSDGRSDEADEYAAAFDDLPIVAQPNRSEGLIELFGTERGERVGCVVLDDGFQHRRIARQFDIVLIDATRSPLDDQLLPLGRLREPMDALARAHAVVVTHAERVDRPVIDRILEAASRHNPALILAVAEHAWVDLRVGDRVEPGEWLKTQTVQPVCAIGNPDAFLRAVESAAGRVRPPMVLRDHDPYKPATVRRLTRMAAGADAIVTTAKDWAKLGLEPTESWPCPVVVPRLEMRFVTGEDALFSGLTRAVETFGDTLDA